MSKIHLHPIYEPLYLAELSKLPLPTTQDGAHFFSAASQLQYRGYRDDFGPLNLACVYRFIEIVEKKIEAHPGHKIVYCAELGARNLTNAVFLAGAYLILAKDRTPNQAWAAFRSRYTLLGYRDAADWKCDFRLSVLSCWRGLARAKGLGWVGRSSKSGTYDMEEYEHYDSAINGELHVVVPGRLIAFRGPRSMPDGRYYRDAHGGREFGPGYYASVFPTLGVSAVIRLNEPEYDAGAFRDAGIEHHTLPFPDSAAPSRELVAAFLRVVDRAPGVVAVHCRAGLGRTGTLAAVYLMLAHGFGAREAMGWLRVVRSGCVLGDQQGYLCGVEARLRGAGLAVGGGEEGDEEGERAPEAEHSLAPLEELLAEEGGGPRGDACSEGSDGRGHGPGRARRAT